MGILNEMVVKMEDDKKILKEILKELKNGRNKAKYDLLLYSESVEFVKVVAERWDYFNDSEKYLFIDFLDPKMLELLAKLLGDDKISYERIDIREAFLLKLYPEKEGILTGENNYVEFKEDSPQRYDYPPSKKYDPNKPPGALQNRVFVGGNYDIMPLLKKICETVFDNGYQPIFAYDFEVPTDEIHDHDIRLLHNCKYAIFEVSNPAGELMEIERVRDWRIATLLIYQIRDKGNPTPPPAVTSMLKTLKYDRLIKVCV